MNKKALSQIVAVALLLLLTLVAAGIVVSFVVPFTKENLERGGGCFEALDNIIFEPTEFNCIVKSSQRTGFSVRIENENIIGFRVGLFSSGNSLAKDITNGISYSDIRMLIGNFSGGGPNYFLEVPKKGEVRTYVANGIFDRAELAPILQSGEKCDLAEDIKIKVCVNNEAINLIKSP